MTATTPRRGDVWGALLEDVLAGRRAHEVVERDDGYVIAFDARYLIAPFRRWGDPVERRAMRFVRGRVLDAGCGGGRVGLHLQARGLDVVGIDGSPGAVACARRRGMRDARVCTLEGVGPELGSFDAVVCLGQTLGALASARGAVRVLDRLAAATTDRGRIVAETFDPHRLEDPVHRRYREGNVARGRMPGQLRLRVRHRELATPWIDWLQLSPVEVDDLARRSSWRLARVLGDGPSHVVVLEKGR